MVAILESSRGWVSISLWLDGGWLTPVAGPLQPRWQNVFKLGNLPSPDGITLPKCVCNWEDGEGLALSGGLCLDLCAHFQVVFRLLRDDEWTEDRAVSVFVGSFPRLKARVLRLKLITKKKERKGVQTKEKDSSQNVSVHTALCVSVTFSWCMRTHVCTRAEFCPNSWIDPSKLISVYVLTTWWPFGKMYTYIGIKYTLIYS